MRTNPILIIVFITLLVSPSCFGALNAYLKLTGELQGAINGSTTQTGLEGFIRVIAYSHVIDSTKDDDTCNSPGATHQALEITKELDIATPLLYRAYAANETMSTFELRLFQPAASGEEENTHTIHLVNARIVRIHQEMLDNKIGDNIIQPVKEHIAFVYEEIVRVLEDGSVMAVDQWSSPCGDRR